MRTTTLVAAAMAAFLGLASASHAEAPGLADKVANAKTAADHEAIAAAYDELAADAKAEAAVHAKMSQAYVGAYKGMQLTNHCDRLIQSYNDQAKEYAALAAQHRTLARAAK